MSRYLKALGLGLIAVVAVSALATSAASAGKLTVSAYPAVLSGVQTGEANKISFEGGRSLECGEIFYLGEYKEGEVAEEMASLAAQYKNCSATILGNVTPATITTNGCALTLSFGSVANATSATGQTNIKCPAGKKIETHIWKTDAEHTANGAAFCTYTIGEQTATGTVNYSADATHAQLTISGSGLALNAERTGGTITNCGKASQATSVSFQATVTAKNEGETQTGTFS